ncbi:MAG: PIN domain nuclease [Mycobacterium sp.]|nr:MAG: PIN domain nuclease [Mycobacterium sp.]
MTEVAATVVDSDVFSLLYVVPASGDPRVQRWQQSLPDRRVLIAFHTRAEVLAGALSAGWDARRMTNLIDVLNRSPTIHSDDEVVGAYAALTPEWQRVGHALHDKVHTGDRWIAACAIAKRLDLLSGDAIYQGAPNLTLRS